MQTAIKEISSVKESSVTGRKIAVASRISGVGMNVPERVVGNDYFANYLETSDQWIRERSGIEQRRWAEADVSASALAEPACRQAMAAAGVGPEDVDGIIFATATPDNTFPSSACVLQHRLGLKKCFAFDLSAACSGFVYALNIADSIIATGQCRHVLVVGAELYSRIINHQDRGTCVLFGDGAGAIVLSSVLEGELRGEAIRANGGYFTEGNTRLSSGIYSKEIHADGSQKDILAVPLGSAQPLTPESVARGDHYLTMAGREVFKQAVRSLVEVSKAVLDKVGLSVADIDYYITHQANKRIISAVGSHLDLPPEKVPMNLQRYGNTSAASLPILLAELVENGSIKPGQLLLISAFGGGLTWGAVLLRW